MTSAAPRSTPGVGLMLYSVRGRCEADLEGTLRAVAELGYDGVELAGLYGREPGVVHGWLEEVGLRVAGSHAPLDALETRVVELAAELAAVGTARVAISWVEPPATAADAGRTVERVARAAERGRAAGLEVGFHNHDGELRTLDDGSTLLDRLADLPLFLELDLGWAWWAGTDPVELLARTAGRAPLVHVKDFGDRESHSYRPVGDGAVGYARIVPAAVAAGVEWLVVEQDETEGDPLEDAARSLAAVRAALEAS